MARDAGQGREEPCRTLHPGPRVSGAARLTDPPDRLGPTELTTTASSGTPTLSARKLTLDDIADVRGYERERPAFREQVIALKKTRRVGVGPLVTLLFENRETMRFQVQEMARVERILSDEAIQHEVDTYNSLIPEPGELSATLFVELTTKTELLEWLPKLVAIERSIELVIGGEVPGASGVVVVRCVPEAAHDAQLTRPDVTSSVHYIRFEMTPAEVDRFADEPVSLVVNHPHYMARTPLAEETKAALLSDLRPDRG